LVDQRPQGVAGLGRKHKANQPCDQNDHSAQDDNGCHRQAETVFFLHRDTSSGTDSAFISFFAANRTMAVRLDKSSFPDIILPAEGFHKGQGNHADEKPFF
jgi:hypothetical protein